MNELEKLGYNKISGDLCDDGVGEIYYNDDNKIRIEIVGDIYRVTYKDRYNSWISTAMSEAILSVIRGRNDRAKRSH